MKQNLFNLSNCLNYLYSGRKRDQFLICFLPSKLSCQSKTGTNLNKKNHSSSYSLRFFKCLKTTEKYLHLIPDSKFSSKSVRISSQAVTENNNKTLMDIFVVIFIKSWFKEIFCCLLICAMNSSFDEFLI